VTNKNDPVPLVPPQDLDFQQPSGEVHINGDGSVVSCLGQENQNCQDANDILDASITDHLGPYFQSTIVFGSASCPASGST